MSGEGERDAKRQKVDSQGFSADTDLEVDVEGETFHVHSLLLMLTSPVFRQMLSHGMKEASARRIDLKGKKMEEFKVFLEAIQPMIISKFVLTAESALFLSRWSDEYQVQSLKEQCEQVLMNSQPVTIEALVHSVECNLPKRKEQCMKGIAGRLEDFLPELKTLGPGLPAPIMELLWPSMCEAADGAEMLEMPDIEQIRNLWPFILSALSLAALKKQQPQAALRLLRATRTRQFSRLGAPRAPEVLSLG